MTLLIALGVVAVAALGYALYKNYETKAATAKAATATTTASIAARVLAGVQSELKKAETSTSTAVKKLVADIKKHL
jgi:uncharacterized membrane protein YebE (DUF533 family)